MEGSHNSNIKLKLSQTIRLKFSLKVLIAIENYKSLSREKHGISHLQLQGERTYGAVLKNVLN
jgi:hypothetical protein